MDNKFPITKPQQGRDFSMVHEIMKHECNVFIDRHQFELQGEGLHFEFKISGIIKRKANYF